jgi:ArsR family transcriptional regulator
MSSRPPTRLPIQPDEAPCCAPKKLRAREVKGYGPLLKVLADETRLQIVALLASAGDELCVCDIESHFDLSQPTISHHLRALRDADVVTSERRGTWIYYSLNRARIDALARLHAALTS